jgi:REP element-mobilizing transposase RayT
LGLGLLLGCGCRCHSNRKLHKQLRAQLQLQPQPPNHHPLPQVVLYTAPVHGGIPLAYLITFRAYGTWLHGDERGSVDRFHNQYDAAYFPPNNARQQQNRNRLKHASVTLSVEQRESVAQAVRETCSMRSWALHALNVRTNHVHAVLSAGVRPEFALNALKANATRQLRQEDRWREPHSPWSDGGSRRYVWTELGLERAVDYVMNRQDEPVPELDERNRLR